MEPSVQNNPEFLEELYRTNKSEFLKVFDEFAASSPDHPLVYFWNVRLARDRRPSVWFSKEDLNHVLVTVLIFGSLATYPSWFNLSELQTGNFYLRNIGFVVFPSLLIYFFRHFQTEMKIRWVIMGILAVFALYINLLPGNGIEPTDTLILAGIHLPVVLWGLLGYVYHRKNYFEYLRFNGDLLVSAGILFLSWMLMSGVTIGLFELIGIKIGEFYPRYIMVYGFSAIPVMALITVIRNSDFVSQVSPWIARIFSPLALVMLSVFLIFFLISGNDPFTNREFLILFNGILVAVLALILFSLSSTEHRWLHVVLLALSVVTILVNLTALSAIIYRLADDGVTPNRIAVLGANILFLIHLGIVGNKLRLLLGGKAVRENVLTSIGNYLPVYLLWAGMVTLFLPLIFGFK